MGLDNTSPKIYLGIFDGKITRKFKEEISGVTKSRVNKEGATVHEQSWNKLTGFITNITTSSKEHNGKTFKNFLVTINDGVDYVLQFPYNSGVSSSFLNSLSNIDFTKQVTFSPWYNAVKDSTTLYLNHGEEKIPWKYTKENPEDCPPWKQVTFKGEEQWDNTDTMNFYDKLLETVIKPKMFAANIARKSGSSPETTWAVNDMATDWNDNDEQPSAAEKDDLPF